MARDRVQFWIVMPGEIVYGEHEKVIKKKKKLGGGLISSASEFTSKKKMKLFRVQFIIFIEIKFFFLNG